jgi:hypothetical protein
MINKIVIRYADGRLRKGTTSDFFPNKDIFHLNDRADGRTYEINVRDLKAVFFVKSYEGDPSYEEKLHVERIGLGRRIKIRFRDGETMVGYTQGYSPARSGFIFFPADPDCNNDKAFIVTASTDDIRFIP